MNDIKQIKTSDFEMEYFSFGAGDKTMIILPGLSIKSVMESKEAIESQYSLLKDEFTIYVFDRRKDLPTTYSILDMAVDTTNAIKKLKLDNIYLFGVSQGAMISLLIAINNPGLIKKLVIGSTSVYIKEDNKAINKLIDIAGSGNKVELFLEFAKMLYPKETFKQHYETLNELGKSITDEELRRFMILAEGTRGFDIRKDINKLSCPTFLIGDKDDFVLGEESSLEIIRLCKNKKDFEYYMYEGYGHAVYDLAPDYVDRLYEFYMK